MFGGQLWLIALFVVMVVGGAGLADRMLRRQRERPRF